MKSTQFMSVRKVVQDGPDPAAIRMYHTIVPHDRYITTTSNDFLAYRPHYTYFQEPLI